MMEQGWKPSGTDFRLSPYTGLTRDSWIDAGKYLLTGIFQNIQNFDDPVVMPRYETEVTYPNAHTPGHKIQAEYFEGLARSFFLAAPMIHAEPELTVCGYRMRDYYRSQVLRSCTKGDPNWVLDMESMKAAEGGDDPFCTFQQTVETGALVICLWLCREEIWDTYTKEEKDRIAYFIKDYAQGCTIPHNWRLFNMLDMAFLYMEGYEIDRDIMRDHAQSILGWYAGDGWYRDGHTFDYYSCWAFNVYTAFWNLWYGYEKEPYLAARFEEQSNRLMETYGDFFDRDGWTNMWGRSCIYRNASTSAFAGNLLMRNPAADPGLARRICSGSLMQFLCRDDLLYQGVPVLGFYGPFLPMVQSYSCAESPFWLAKAFLCLYFPKDHPFWIERERGGTWESLGVRETKTTVLDGPGLCFCNHGANGTTELRTGKAEKEAGDDRGMWNYCKLSYSTKYPWESEPVAGIESQQYVLRDLTTDSCSKANALLWSGEREGVLYRRAVFGYSSSVEYLRTPAMDLADFAVPFGTFRADKMRFFRRPLELTLGAYGFPDNGTLIEERELDGAKAMILKGHDHMGREKQLAMTVFDGWDSLKLVRSEGTNADSAHSMIVCARLRREKQYGYEPYLLLSQVLTKESSENFTQEELFPIKEIRYADPTRCGGYGPVTVLFKDGTLRTVDFYGMEARLMV